MRLDQLKGVMQCCDLGITVRSRVLTSLYSESPRILESTCPGVNHTVGQFVNLRRM